MKMTPPNCAIMGPLCNIYATRYGPMVLCVCVLVARHYRYPRGGKREGGEPEGGREMGMECDRLRGGA